MDNKTGAIKVGKPLDILIKNGTVIDGSGNPAFHVDIAIIKDRIVAMERLNNAEATQVIDANGKIVSPGFIDAHSHTDATVPYNPGLESSIRKGVTTEIVGNCGNCFVPAASADSVQALKISSIQLDDDVPIDSLGAFTTYLENRGLGGNLAWLIGHNSVRSLAGVSGKNVTDEQIKQMQRTISQAMADGALGLSTGLEFEPGRSATTDEINQLMKPVAERDGIYTSHIRNRDSALSEAMDEFMSIVKSSRTRGEVSHLNVRYNTGAPNKAWEKAVETIEKVRKEGFDILADITPLKYGMGQMAGILPAWIRTGSPRETAEQLKDPEIRTRLRNDCDRYWRFIHRGEWHRIYMQSNPAFPEINGLSFPEIASRWGKDPWDCYFDILSQAGESLDAAMLIGELFTDVFLHQAVSHPLFMLTSDGYSSRIDGKLAEQSLFPLHFMGIVHYLIHFVRETRTLTLTEAVRKMTSMPASHFRLADRGLLKTGCLADIAIFDFDKLHSDSNFTNPLVYPRGIEHVLVNGVPVISQNKLTGAMPGRNLIRKTGSSWV
jgi:N-acyl-D-amino-acid deacylase